MPQDRFPDDENGDALRNMEQSGDDLSKARDVEFSVTFQQMEPAQQFFEAIGASGLHGQVQRQEGGDQLWDVIVTCWMSPSHAGITAMEDRLEKIASPLGGWNDGWGCFAVPRSQEHDS